MKHIGIAALALLMIWPLQGGAATTTTQVRATMQLTSGCVVNSIPAGNNASAVDFGRIDFGKEPAQFTTAEAQAVGSGAGIIVRCTPGVAPVLRFGAGLNDGRGTGTGVRAMKESAKSAYVTYNLFSDVGRSSIIAVGGAIVLANSGAEQTVQVYARAYGARGVVPGSYSDQIIVSIEL